MRKGSVWLRLVRVAALPTALADVWLGAALVGRLFSPEALAVSAVSLCLYAAGMILNDVHDVAWDREHNPTRPLPAGEVSRPAAAAVGLALVLLGVGAAALIGQRPFLVAASIAVAVLGYDFVLKGGVVGPVNMALCRGLNVLLGLAIGAPRDFLFHLPAAAPVFVYVIGVTWLARFETEGRQRRPLLVATAGVALAAVLVVLLHVRSLSEKFGGQIPPSAGPLVFLQVVFGLLVLVALWAVCRAAWSTQDVRKIVRGLLLGIVPLQGLVALAHFRVFGMVCILALLVPLLLLRKQSHVT